MNQYIFCTERNTGLKWQTIVNEHDCSFAGIDCTEYETQDNTFTDNQLIAIVQTLNKAQDNHKREFIYSLS